MVDRRVVALHLTFGDGWQAFYSATMSMTAWQSGEA
jgi:hypothetical protein